MNIFFLVSRQKKKETIKNVGKEQTNAFKSLNSVKNWSIENIFPIDMMTQLVKKNVWNERHSKSCWNKR